jgi:hypothetical protein
MGSETNTQPRYDYGLLGALGIAFILLAVAPRLFPEIELSRRTILWVSVIHQLLLATTFAFAIWIMTGKRRVVALTLTCIIILIWGPNFAAAIEYSVSGKNTTVLALADRAGVTPVLNAVYVFLSDALGYSLTVSKPQ